MFTALNAFLTKLFNAFGKGADILDHLATAGVSLSIVAEETAGEYEDQSRDRRAQARADSAKLLTAAAD